MMKLAITVALSLIVSSSGSSLRISRSESKAEPESRPDRVLKQTDYEVTCESTLISGISCDGPYCTVIQVDCNNTASVLTSSSYWSESFSEEQNEMYCDEGYYISGLSCKGKYCDDMQLQCTESSDAVSEDCSWSDWVSEEGTGELRFTGYATGVDCSGGYCDDKRFLVCDALVEDITPPLEPAVCQPTSGSCASTAAELQEQLAAVTDQSPAVVVAVCGDTTIYTATTLTTEIAGSSLTLCCSSGSGCVIRSYGRDDNLVVNGSGDFTVQDITFLNGNALGVSTSEGGGNLRITARGEHKIKSCIFEGGKGKYKGGNLLVSASNTISIEDSVFSNGRTSGSGGGASIHSETDVTVVRSEFSNNSGKSGGGLSFFFGKTGNSVIDGCSFKSNEAKLFGGGFTTGIATAIGQLPSISVLNTAFENNKVTEPTAFGSPTHGGAGNLGGGTSTKSVDIVLSGNTGSGNFATGCNGITAVYPNATGTVTRVCVGVDDEYSY